MARRCTELGTSLHELVNGRTRPNCGNYYPLVGCCCRGRCLVAERHIDRIRRHGLCAAILCATRRYHVAFNNFDIWDTVFGFGTGDVRWCGTELGVCSWSLRHRDNVGPVISRVLNDTWSAGEHPLLDAHLLPSFNTPDQHDVTPENCALEHEALVRGCWPLGSPFVVTVHACPGGRCPPDTFAELQFVRD